MKKILAGLVLAGLAGLVHAQEPMTVNVRVTVAGASRAEMVELLEGLPPAYTNVSVVLTNQAGVVTNLVRRKVVEGSQAKFKRISGDQVEAFWTAMLAEARRKKVPAVDAVSAE